MKRPRSSIVILAVVALGFSKKVSSFAPFSFPSTVGTTLKPSLSPLSVTKPKTTNENQLKKSRHDEKEPSPLIKLASSPIGALAVLDAVVLFHESGHYLTARSLGVRADEFSIGFGPKLLGFQAFGGDNFSLRLLPMGGYVSLPGAELATLLWEQRVLILSAGVICNLLLAFFIYWSQIVFGPGLTRPVFEPGIIVSGLSGPDAPASGILRSGDVIVGIEGKPLKMPTSPSEFEVQRTISRLISTTQATPDGESLQLSIQRDQKFIDVTVTPKCMEPLGPPSMGVFLQPNFVEVETLQSRSAAEAAALASQTVADFTKETAIGFVTFTKDLLSGKSKTSEYRVSGPVRVVERASEVVATKDWNTVLKYAAAVSVNLGVLNTFPVPPSDGFQILFTLVQALISQELS